MTSAPVTHDDVLGVLRGVVDPELGTDIVDLGMVRNVSIDGGDITVTVALTTAGCPLRAEIQRDVRGRVGAMEGVTKVHLRWDELTQDEKAAAMSRARLNIAQRSEVTSVHQRTKVVLIASGKGGVGKSSVTVNLAAGLAAEGAVVGILDADIWGYSVPRLLGVDGRLDSHIVDGKAFMIPNERTIGAGAVRSVSMGFLVDGETTALMWRGLMLNRGVQHFLQDVDWGDDLDYLLIDMPPGTGDVQMGVAKLIPRAEMLVVTTPAKNAQKVASRVVSMARKNYLKVTGVIENMTSFTCEHGETYNLFGEGGGQALADAAGVPLLGQIPLEPTVAVEGDLGTPVVLGDGPAGESFRTLAKVVREAIPPTDMSGCTARMMSAVDAALDELDRAEAEESGSTDVDTNDQIRP